MLSLTPYRPPAGAACSDKVNGESNGGNRYATVLMYLNDVEEGGETGEWQLNLSSGGAELTRS